MRAAWCGAGGACGACVCAGRVRGVACAVKRRIPPKNATQPDSVAADGGGGTPDYASARGREGGARGRETHTRKGDAHRETGGCSIAHALSLSRARPPARTPSLRGVATDPLRGSQALAHPSSALSQTSALSLPCAPWPQYERAQLYTVVEVSRQETHGQDSGVEILKNEPYDNEHGKGQYTHKIYHLGSKVPKFIAAIAPGSALKLEEEAWNGYPYCKTVLTNPFLGERFRLTITSKHEADTGKLENVHNLEGKTLKDREVVMIDVANDKVEEKDYHEHTDPRKFKSEKTGRGPLGDNWLESTSPVMCCYKLVELKFKVFGLESSVESFAAKVCDRNQEERWRGGRRRGGGAGGGEGAGREEERGRGGAEGGDGAGREEERGRGCDRGDAPRVTPHPLPASQTHLALTLVLIRAASPLHLSFLRLRTSSNGTCSWSSTGSWSATWTSGSR